MPLDPLTEEYIRRTAGSAGTPVNIPPDIPSAAGIPSLLARSIPNLSSLGVVYTPFKKPFTKPLSDVMFVRKGQDTETMAHEIEHLLARRGLGTKPYAIEDKFDELYKGQGGEFPTSARQDFVQAAIKLAPYLEQKYGFTPDFYFSPEHLGTKKYPANLFSEQLASLSALEQTKNVDLTKDPIIRKTLFNDPLVRQTYNAMTGLRQTRLDPRDISPYTPVPEKTDDVTRLAKTEMPDEYRRGGRVRMI